MNIKAKAALVISVGAVFIIALLMGIYYFISYNSKDNALADAINKGNAFFAAECYDDAIYSYETALEYDQDNVQIENAIIATYLEKGKSLGDSEAAIDAFMVVIDRDNDNRSAYWGIADVCEHMGDEDRMLEVLRRGYENTMDRDMNEKISAIMEVKEAQQANEEEKEQNLAAEQEIADKRDRLMRPLENKLAEGDIKGAMTMLRTEQFMGLGEDIEEGESYYIGALDDKGKRKGLGLALYSDGFYYYGSFEDDKRSGHGLWFKGSYPDSSTILSYLFEGEWENDKPNGTGVETLTNNFDNISVKEYEKRIIEGNYIDGKEEGKMKLTTVDKVGRSVEYEYISINGIAEKIATQNKDDKKNEQAQELGIYEIARSKDGKTCISSDGSERGVFGFIEQEEY